MYIVDVTSLEINKINESGEKRKEPRLIEDPEKKLYLAITERTEYTYGSVFYPILTEERYAKKM